MAITKDDIMEMHDSLVVAKQKRKSIAELLRQVEEEFETLNSQIDWMEKKYHELKAKAEKHIDERRH